MINEINLDNKITVILEKFCNERSFDRLYYEVYEFKESGCYDKVMYIDNRYLSDYEKLRITEGGMFDESIQILLSKEIDLNKFFKYSKNFQTLVLELAAMIEDCKPEYIFISNIEKELSYIDQQNIIPVIRKAFPEVHFIILTNSAFVFQSLKKEELFIPKDKKDEILLDKHPYLLGIEELLEKFFNIYNQNKK